MRRKTNKVAPKIRTNVVLADSIGGPDSLPDLCPTGFLRTDRVLRMRSEIVWKVEAPQTTRILAVALPAIARSVAIYEHRARGSYKHFSAERPSTARAETARKHRCMSTASQITLSVLCLYPLLFLLHKLCFFFQWPRGDSNSHALSGTGS
jgi:hypothetical protein